VTEPPRPSGSPSDGGTGRPDSSGGPDDRALLAAHIDGDPDAFGALFARHRDRLWAVALRTTGDPEEAADALQDAMVAAFRRAASYRGDAAVTTWLHRVVVNACLDRLRRRKVRLADPLPDDLDAHADRGTLVTGNRSTPGPDDPADRAVADERRAAVLAALETLPTEQRAALVLVDMEGYSVEETAAILECAPGTVKSRCSRGRSRLAPLLADLAPAADRPRRNRSGHDRVPSTSPDPGAGTPAAANAPPPGAAPASSDVPADPGRPDRPDPTDEEVSSP
jgi:RNA polymerase sigma-70 factor (ECF subfamily)